MTTTPGRSRLRLDEILVFEGLVTEEQVKIALEFQKQEGGRIGSHLLKLGFVDEAGLILALEKQLGCRGVALESIEVDEHAFAQIPEEVARARKIVPFEYDEESNTLKVACENPDDEQLVKEITYVAHGKKIQLYIGLEINILKAIENGYDKKASVPDEEPCEFSETVVIQNGKVVKLATGKTRTVSTDEKHVATVLLVTDDLDSDIHIKQTLENERFKVLTTDSADDAIDMIGDQSFHTVFIRDTVPGDYIDLIDRLRKISLGTVVRYYESAAKLLLNNSSSTPHADLMIKNLDLYTSLLASRDKLENSRAVRVGQFTDKLCTKLGLADKDRIAIVNAAYMLDLASFYYADKEHTKDARESVKATVKLLDSVGYPPIVPGILKSMYINLHGKYTKRLPIEALGGNIITTVDMYCDSVANDDRLTLDRFETLRERFQSSVGKLFLAEVVEAFLDIIRRDVLPIQEIVRFNQVMIYGKDEEQTVLVDRRIRAEGYRTMVPENADRFLELFHRSKPDFLLLVSLADAKDVTTFVNTLPLAGSDISEVPTFLIADTGVAGQSTHLLETGIEDVIPWDNNLDLLVLKLHKKRGRLETESTNKTRIIKQTGTRGTIEDMNLIDLLQALGPARKTVRITASSGDDQLIVYLKGGQIWFAVSTDKVGAEAVYKGIAWTTGSWHVLPQNEDDLPDSNNDLPTESILMEGCRLIDEEIATSSGKIGIKPS